MESKRGCTFVTTIYDPTSLTDLGRAKKYTRQQNVQQHGAGVEILCDSIFMYVYYNYYHFLNIFYEICYKNKGICVGKSCVTHVTTDWIDFNKYLYFLRSICVLSLDDWSVLDGSCRRLWMRLRCSLVCGETVPPPLPSRMSAH